MNLFVLRLPAEEFQHFSLTFMFIKDQLSDNREQNIIIALPLHLTLHIYHSGVPFFSGPVAKTRTIVAIRKMANEEVAVNWSRNGIMQCKVFHTLHKYTRTYVNV